MSQGKLFYLWRVFEPHHLDEFELLDDQKELILEQKNFFASLGSDMEKGSYCGTAFWKDQPLYVGGWWELEPGVAQVFVIPDARALKRYPVAMIRTIVKWRQFIERDGRFEKIVSVCVPLPHIHNWMRHLGFSQGGMLADYAGPGKDYSWWIREKVNGVWRRK